MILEKGDMWSVYDTTDLFCITTNASINNRGELVMGRGIALEAKKKFPELPRALAKQMTGPDYHLMINWSYKIGAFQVKYKWHEQADLQLICQSTTELFKYIVFYGPNRVDLNFPGIGNGRLNRKYVLPIITYLPDIVHVWELP